MKRISLAFLFLVLLPTDIVRAASPNIVISQAYGGGGNSGAPLKNDFVELFNRGAAVVSLSGMSIQYASATGTGNFGSNPIVLLSGSLAPGQYYLIQLAGGTAGSALPTPDATGTVNMAAASGKVALINSTAGLACNGGSTPCSTAQLALIVDLVGYGSANFYEGSPAPAASNSTSVIRAGGGCTDSDNNASDFSAGAPAPRNSASPFHYCAGPVDPSGAGTANPASLPAGGYTLLTVAVIPGANPPSTGLAVTANLMAIGGSSGQVLYDDGTNGDILAGDNTFSYLATVAGSTTAGSKTLPVTITDAQSRAGSTAIVLTVEPPAVAIHSIQGPGDSSPVAGQLVATTGIVTGIKSNGFFIQTPDAEVDSYSDTSEGIFIFTSSAPPTGAAVGNLVKVVGTVQEFVPSADPASPPMTEIISPAVTAISTGNNLPAPVTLDASDTSPSGGLEQLERFEGMRVHVEALNVISPTAGAVNEVNATGSSNGVFYGILPGVARPFTEPGVLVRNPLPSGAPCCVPRFDGNPEKLRVDSDALAGAARIEVTSGAIITGITGPLDYAFRAYTIDPDPGNLSPDRVTGIISAIPVPDACPAEFTVATSNLQRFFDTINDPDISEPALTSTAFTNRLKKVSLAVRDVMKFPDIIGVEEVENLSTLQSLADRISLDAAAAGQPDPHYAPHLVEGNDIGGIDVGFLLKSPRVTVVEVNQVGKDTTYFDPVGNVQALLNDRPPLVLRAMILAPAGPPFPVTVIVNHLRSLSGIDDPVDGPRVRAKRAAQAEFLAGLIQQHQAAGEQVVSVGDYNATQFSDGYVDVMGTVLGAPAPFDEVILATAAGLVNPPPTDLLDFAPAPQRYSYVFDGNAQELDHILVAGDLVLRVNGLYYARNNADFPESYRSDPARPERFSDHDIPVAYFQLPLFIANASVSQSALWPVNHKMIPITVSYDLQNLCSAIAPVTVILSVSCNEPVNGTGDGNSSPDWIVVDAHHVQLRAERAGTGGGRVYTITITATDGNGNVATRAVTVTVPHDK